MSTTTNTSKINQFLYNHVFLPRKLPGGPERLERGIGQRALSGQLLKACRTVYQIALPEHSDELQQCCRMVHLTGQLNDEQHLDEVKLREAFNNVDNGNYLAIPLNDVG